MELELNNSSPMSGGLSPPNCASDPEEKEISDDDDDDRNHKHRRREARSQSLERDSLEQSLTQPYRKRNRSFENGQNDAQSHYNLDRDFPKFDKRRPTGVNFSRFSGEHGPGRGRGRDFQRDSRFSSIDVASHMAHPGSIPSALFPGRGLPNVSNGPSASWNGFGLIPAIPNGAIDAINPLGLPGMLRPQLNPPLNMGIQRQRCRDFEERGFCLRGDMCPMEHGVNRIVIEDVQSLSQFNLPVSVPSAHLMGTSPGGGFVPSVSANTMINNRVLHSRASKSAVDDDALSLDGTFSGAINATGADVYDPDQPLWTNDVHDTSAPILGLQPSNNYESECLVDGDLSDRLVRSSGAAIGSQSTSSSVWGRLNSSKNKMELKEKFDSSTKPLGLGYAENRSKEILEASAGVQGASHPGKQNKVGPKTVGSTSKVQNDIGSNVRKPTQKAQRTLFVNCIPLKDNKKENLLSHFKKFGEVIDIYIPANSERAFVQFSKREEAERALKAPDAVMGSRFIKLWWANRDSIADEGLGGGNSVSLTTRNVPTASGSPHPVVTNKGKDNPQYPTSKGIMPKPADSLVSVGNDSKPVSMNGPKALPQVQKKVENLELLKEELRKKQEMLEQKRNEFRRQLDKLAKQATGIKSEVQAGQAIKRQKVEMSTDTIKAGQSADAVASGSSGQAEILVDKVPKVESTASPRSKPNSAVAFHDPLSSKHAARPMANSGAPFYVNRYKLDNRPTSFRIHGPLPAALADVAAMRDHFSLYGEISNVEIDDLGEDCCHGASDVSEAMRKCSARISFATRDSAETAFLKGKSWHGHNLKFMWVTTSIPCSSRSSGESSSATRGALMAEVQSAEKATHDNSHNALDTTKSSSSPCKSLNEHSGDSSRSGGKGSSPADAEGRSGFEAQSPDKSANFIPLEADELENRDSEEREEAGGDDGKQPDEDSKASPQR